MLIKVLTNFSPKREDRDSGTANGCYSGGDHNTVQFMKGTDHSHHKTESNSLWDKRG